MPLQRNKIKMLFIMAMAHMQGYITITITIIIIIIIIIIFFDVIEYKQRVQSEEFKKAWHEEKLRDWKGENMYGQYLRAMPDTTDVVGTWEWLRTVDLKVQTEALLCAAQEQAIRTNSI